MYLYYYRIQLLNSAIAYLGKCEYTDALAFLLLHFRSKFCIDACYLSNGS